MFRNMTKKSGSIVIYIMFAIIILTFIISFGPASRKGCNPDAGYVASVNSDIISAAEYRHSYNNLFEFYRRSWSRFNRSFNKQEAQKMGLSKQVLDMLVNELLFAQRSRELGFHISKDEVIEQIKSSPQFQQNGTFDFELYSKVIRYQLSSTPSEFEENTAEKLLGKKLQSFITASVGVSNTEVKDDFLSRNEKVSAQFIVFSPQTMTEAAKKTIRDNISDKKIKTFLKNDRDRVQAYYDNNIGQFRKGKQVRARHILIKTDDDTDENAAREKIKSIRKEIDAGTDFAEAAKKYSEGPSGEKGGDLGYFEKGKMVPAFDEVVFSMEKGTVSDPVKTQFGVHLIMLEDVKAPVDRKLEEVETDIARRLILNDTVKDLARAEAEKATSLLQNKDYTTENLRKEFDSWNITEKKPVSLTRNSSFIPGIGIDQSLVSRLFSSKIDSGYLPDVTNIDNKSLITRIAEREHADLKKFEEEKGTIRDRLHSLKSRQIIEEYISELRENADIQVNRNFISAFTENM